MHIPVYVVTGFLDAGKTTILNNLLNKPESQDRQILVIQFEFGEADFRSWHLNCHVMKFPKKALEQHSMQISEQIYNYLIDHRSDEIWIEWNSVTPFDQLLTLLMHPSLYKQCRIRKVIHMVDARRLEELLLIPGGVLPEQIANCDFAVMRNVHSDRDFHRFRKRLRDINPDVTIYETKQAQDIYFQVYRKGPVNLLISMLTGTFSKFDVIGFIKAQYKKGSSITKW